MAYRRQSKYRSSKSSGKVIGGLTVAGVVVVIVKIVHLFHSVGEINQLNEQQYQDGGGIIITTRPDGSKDTVSLGHYNDSIGRLLTVTPDTAVPGLLLPDDDKKPLVPLMKN